MEHYEFGWNSPSGVKIYAQSWSPDKDKFEKPKAVILLVHGLGEHSARYAHVAEFFAQHGIALIANDRSGHGKSGNKRGHVNKYAEVFDDIIQLRKEAHTRYPNVPLFLYGHSMGGGIVLDYLQNEKPTYLKGVIATSPLLEPAFNPPAFILFVGSIMRHIYPKYTEDNQLDVQKISRSKETIEAYIKDPLVHSKVTSEMAIGMLQSGKKTLANAGRVSAPLLLLHGSADELTSYPATEKFAQKSKGDVSFKAWKGFYHELHNEPEKLEVLNYIYEWILKKM